MGPVISKPTDVQHRAHAGQSICFLSYFVTLSCFLDFFKTRSSCHFLGIFFSLLSPLGSDSLEELPKIFTTGDSSETASSEKVKTKEERAEERRKKREEEKAKKKKEEEHEKKKKSSEKSKNPTVATLATGSPSSRRRSTASSPEIVLPLFLSNLTDSFPDLPPEVTIGH